MLRITFPTQIPLCKDASMQNVLEASLILKSPFLVRLFLIFERSKHRYMLLGFINTSLLLIYKLNQRAF